MPDQVGHDDKMGCKTPDQVGRDGEAGVTVKPGSSEEEGFISIPINED